ncbi:MAG: hypothetical protein ACXACK_00980 [Candidatus Hodarchaeales archaeon]
MSVSGTIMEFFSIAIAGIAFPGFNYHVTPGLYPIGHPTDESPILVTANYFVTYKRVISSLEDQNITAWLLVIDTEGINVWCSAAGGRFNAEKILEQIDESDLTEAVNHKNLILPQLTASGVDHNTLKKAGWEVKFGPVEIHNFGEFLKKDQIKTPQMALVDFSLKKRLENSFSHNFFISLVLIPLILGLAILAQPLFFFRPWVDWLVPNSIFLLIYIWVFGFLYGIFYNRLPFNSGFLKGIFLTIILVPLCTVMFFLQNVSNSIIGFCTLIIYSLSISTDFDGFTPYWGTDFYLKDMILLAGTVLIVLCVVIFLPFTLEIFATGG